MNQNNDKINTTKLVFAKKPNQEINDLLFLMDTLFEFNLE